MSCEVGFDVVAPPEAAAEPLGVPMTVVDVTKVWFTAATPRSERQVNVELGGRYALYDAASTSPPFMSLTMFVPGPLRLKSGRMMQPPGPDMTTVYAPAGMTVG